MKGCIRQNSLNTKIEPHNESSKKLNVVKVQSLELFDRNNLTQNNAVSNIYQGIVLVMKESTQEYYNMRMVLGLECA